MTGKNILKTKTANPFSFAEVPLYIVCKPKTLTLKIKKIVEFYFMTEHVQRVGKDAKTVPKERQSCWICKDLDS